MKVEDVMIRDVKTIEADATVEEAVLKMSELKIGSLVVMDNFEIVGILTARDIIGNIKSVMKEADSLAVKELMSKKVVPITPEKGLEEAARIMAKEDVKKLPVMIDGKLVGIITDTDILKSGEKLEEAVARNIINILGYTKGKMHPAY